jgi:hypothetical protein
MFPPSLRRLVIDRSGERCDYCQLAQVGQAASFHIDHVTPISAGGQTVAENLALACINSLTKRLPLAVRLRQAPG